MYLSLTSNENCWKSGGSWQDCTTLHNTQEQIKSFQASLRELLHYFKLTIYIHSSWVNFNTVVELIIQTNYFVSFTPVWRGINVSVKQEHAIQRRAVAPVPPALLQHGMLELIRGCECSVLMTRDRSQIHSETLFSPILFTRGCSDFWHICLQRECCGYSFGIVLPHKLHLMLLFHSLWYFLPGYTI